MITIVYGKNGHARAAICGRALVNMLSRQEIHLVSEDSPFRGPPSDWTWGRPPSLTLAVHCQRVWPREVLYEHECYCLHDSLLPEGRGHSPTVWAVLNSDKYMGASLFRMTGVVDGGPVIGQVRRDLFPYMTVDDVLDNLDNMYAQLVERCVPAILRRDHSWLYGAEEMATTFPRVPEDIADLFYNWTGSIASLQEEYRRRHVEKP